MDEAALLRLRRVLWTQTAAAIRDAWSYGRRYPKWLDRYQDFELGAGDEI